MANNFMPGETYGIPNQIGGMGGGMNGGGLLSNPYLQMGLGILANNNTKNLGQVLGRGALQGLGNVQQQQQFQAQMAQQQQIAKLNQARQKQLETEMQQTELQNKAVEEASAKNPELAQLFRLDPKAAIRTLYPQVNQTDPYTEVIYDEQGQGWLNNRRETDPSKVLQPISVGGKPFIGAKVSPELAGRLKESEARATAGYNINTDIPGMVSTARQVAEQANPALGLPQKNNMQISPQVQRGRDDKRMQVLLAEQAAEGGAGRNPELDKEIQSMQGRGFGGIAVPTKAQEAGQIEAEKMKAEAGAKAQINLPNLVQEGQNTIKLVDDLMASPGFGMAVGKSRMLQTQRVPGTPAFDFDNRLEQLKGKQFLQAYESLKGAGAITDIEGTKAGNAISRMNASTSEGEFKKAADEFKSVIQQGVERAKAKAGGGSIMPTGERMPKAEAVALPAKPSTLTLKKGTVYQTPKGALRWNGKAFED